MYKKLKFKGGLRLFKGIRFLVLPSVPEATFIQGAMFIPDSRVGRWSIMRGFKV